MASVKATFTLDEESAARLADTSKRLNRPKSAVVRDAIHEYSERAEQLSASERRRLLTAFDELVPKIPQRPVARVDAELEAIRESRRHGGRGAAGGSA